MRGLRKKHAETREPEPQAAPARHTARPARVIDRARPAGGLRQRPSSRLVLRRLPGGKPDWSRSRHEGMRYTAGLNEEVFDALLWMAAGHGNTTPCGWAPGV